MHFESFGFSANATLSEIHKAAESMKRRASLAPVTMEEADIPALGMVPRTEADIRAATGRLTNPTLRLRERLFWFHVVQTQRGMGAPPLQRIPSEPLEPPAMCCAMSAQARLWRHKLRIAGWLMDFPR